MQLSYKDKPHNRVDYFPLPNGFADVFLHRNEKIEIGEDGDRIYVAEEVCFQIEQSATKEFIEQNFEYMWDDAENPTTEPTEIEILKKEKEVLAQSVYELAGIVELMLTGGVVE